MKRLIVAILTTLLLAAPVIADNTSLGTSALGSITTGFDNIALGQFALPNLTTGYSNIAIGQWAGAQLTTGFNNVLIGFMAGDALTTEDAKLYIMHRGAHATNGIFGDFADGDFNVVGTWGVSGAVTLSDSLDVAGTLDVAVDVQLPLSRPASPASGSMYYETTTDSLYLYTGSAWKSLELQ